MILKYFIGIFVLLVFTSCGTTAETRMVFDNTVPIEESSNIILNSDLVIAYYNGNFVNYRNVNMWKLTEAVIPSGEARLILSLNGARSGNIIYSGGSYLVTYNFESGHEYFLTYDSWGRINKDQFTVVIQNRTTKTRDKLYAYHIDITQQNNN
ncbi:MAG: hypothetical protein FWG99_05420 [Treponema sp.]|nr:hypothetical protein [Treponema sp.]